MHDIKRIREDSASFDEAMLSRNSHPVSSIIIDIDLRRKEAVAKLQQMQARRNKIASLIGRAKNNKEDA
ncbi:MAG: hypothetical protein LBD81_00745, partial [Holosporaceae bacterium]|nr:hypothetical protein [Holosporaceae bacterium]